MNDVTLILQEIEEGDPQAAEKLLPLVYNELRKLAAAKMAQEKPGQTFRKELSLPSAEILAATHPWIQVVKSLFARCQSRNN